jgi:RimJ/RimL family protein N-acetyltransferase
LFSDSEVMLPVGKEPVASTEQARSLIEEGVAGWRRDSIGPFIVETAAGEAVGQVGLMVFDRRGWRPSSWADAGDHAQAELGWMLIPAHWGHGYATEAAAAIREWAYECRPIRQLVSLISSDNVPSQRVAQRLGATPTESFRQPGWASPDVVWRHPTPHATD